MAFLAGMPRPILTAYINYIENLYIVNNLVGNLGKPHHRKCGIPQGCLLSMMFTALLLRPWVGLMKTCNAIPRVLADDLLILNIGRGHLEAFTKALNATHEFLYDMGARVASNKSYNFSNNKGTRTWLRTHIWTKIEATISVINHGRDLGAHFCFTTSNHAGTIID